jgi:hypothetical protein
MARKEGRKECRAGRRRGQGAFLHDHREASALASEIPEESEQFRFLRAACYFS